MYLISRKQCVVLAVALLVPAAALAGFVDQSSRLQFPAYNRAAAWGDYNNDTYVDLFETHINRNEDATNFANGYGISGGGGRGIWADYDNDGYLDAYSYFPFNGRLYRNLAGSNFALIPTPPLPDVPGSWHISRGATWGDFDNDGFVDLYVGGYEIFDQGISFPDAILHNQGGTSFVISWTQSTLYRARGVTACDFDKDGDIDIYVSNYRLQPNLLWVNNGAGNFTESASTYGVVAGNGHSIGAAWGDIDNDGHIDLFAGNFAHPGQPESRFYRNLGPGGSYHFEDKGTSGVYYQESYSSPVLGDYDNDGDLDLYFSTVYPADNAVLFRNDGNWNFTDVTGAEGLGGIPQTSQAAWADIDNDGDLDLSTAARMYVNQGNANHWLRVHVQGDGSTVNRAAIGAQVRIDLGGGTTLTRPVEGGTSEGGQNDLTLHFGLGSRTAPVDLDVYWPGGSQTTVTSVSVDQTVTVGLVTTTSILTTSTLTSSTSTSTTSTSSSTSPFDEACVYYPVDAYGGTQSDTVQDASGNGQHGIADSEVFPLGLTIGKNGSAVQFSGGGDIYIAGEMPPSASRFRNESLGLGTSDYTIMMWVRATDAYEAVGGSDGRVFVVNDAGDPVLYLSSSGKVVYSVLLDGASMASTSGSDIPVDSQWYHVAVVVNRDNAGASPSAIYVDANNMTSTDTMEDTPSSLDPGASEFWLWGRSLKGQGDDFAIFKQALSQAQVASFAGLTTLISTTSSTTTVGTSTTSIATTSSTSTTNPFGTACLHYTVEAYGGTQSDTVPDASGNGQHGIADSFVYPLGASAGRNGNSANFLGGSDIYIAGEDPPSSARFQNETLDLGTDDYTILMWVRATDAYDVNGGNDGRVFVVNNAGDPALYLSSGGEIVYSALLDNASMASTGSSAIPVDSDWYHVAVVVNRDNVGENPSGIYVNSVDVTGANTMENTPTSLTPDPGEYWLWGRALNGQGDDFAIFKQALSAAQISSVAGFTTVSTSISRSTTTTTTPTTSTSTTTLIASTSTTTTSTTSSTTTTTLTNIIQDFESWPQTVGWGSTVHEGWTLSDGQVKQNRGGYGPPIDTQCGWLYDYADSTNSWIQSPLFADGVNSVSFWTRQDILSGGSSFAVLQTSSTENEWIDLDSFTVSTNGWAQRMYSVDTTIPTYLRIRKTGDTAPGTYAGVDNISVLVNVAGATTTIATTTTTTTSPLFSACVHYTVDAFGGTQSDTVPDVSGNGQHGVADSFAFPVGVTAGRNGNAVQFGGASDIYIAGEAPPSGNRHRNESLLLGTSDYTIVMWVRATGAYSPGGGSNGRVLVVNNVGDPALYLDRGGKIAYDVLDDGATMASTNGTAIPVDSLWHYVAVVVNRDNTGGNPSAIYVDCVDVTGTDTMENTPSSLNPGAEEFWLWGRALTGQGDDFAIYKQALSQDEIASLAGFTTLSTSTSSSTTIAITTSSTTSTTSIFTTSTTSTTSPFTGQHNVDFNYGGGYWSFESGDIDLALAFGHGFLSPGSADGARIDFWFAPDGVIDGTGVEGGGGASIGAAHYAAGGNDFFIGVLVMGEDGVDQYQAGAGLDVDSFAFSPGSLTNVTGSGFADGTAAGYGRVFENDNPQGGDWYYVGESQMIRDVSVVGTPPNAIPIGRAQGVGGLDAIDGTPWSFLVTAATTTTTTSTTTTTLMPPVIVYMDTDITLWAIYAPTGASIPAYSTNLGTMPIEWIPISAFSNALVGGTNVIEFAPPDTNAAAVFFTIFGTP